MSKSCCFAVVLAVICLSVILLSLEADAQPTVDETMTCGASTLEEVVSVVKTIESNQQETAKDMKTLLGSGSVDKNETCRLEDVVKEIKDVKSLLGSGSVEKNETCRLEDAVKEIKEEIRLLAANQMKIELGAWEPSKQALVSALVCECLVWFLQRAAMLAL